MKFLLLLLPLLFISCDSKDPRWPEGGPVYKDPKDLPGGDKYPYPPIKDPDSTIPPKDTYSAMCASCHGIAGNGESPMSGSLPKHPRNFKDSNWQKSVTDEHLTKVIKEGGASVGLDPIMPAWPSLTDSEVKELVSKIRSFGS